MYLLSAETEIDWVIGITDSIIALADLDLLFIQPDGVTVYSDSPIDISRYTAPTESVPGAASYLFTPELEGLWKIRLVIGTADNYRVLNKVEMYVLDNTTVVEPYSPEIGKPVPYDISYFLQGYSVPTEMVGSFIATRDISISGTGTSNRAKATVGADLIEQVFYIKYNDVQVGTITFAVGQLLGVVVIQTLQLIPGDVLQIFTSATIDLEIRDISITLVGCSDVSACELL